MKTKICSALLALMTIPVVAQSGWVGINTSTPQANLDVNGTMKIRQTPTAPALPGYQILAVNKNTGGDFQVSQVDPQLIADLAVNSGVNTSVTKVSASGTGNLLGLSLSNGYQPIDFPAATIGTANFNATTNTYTVPSSGLYAIKYSYRYGNGVQLRLLSLSGNPRIGIFNGSTLLDESIFSGANVDLLGIIGVLSVLISETHIDSVYQLTAGSQLTFQANQGGVNVDLLSTGNITTSVVIYKISN